MLFERFETEGLAHYSYAVGCPEAGRTAIVDPRRDLDIYFEFADRHQVKISHVLETHIHADYASGALELARRTGAELLVSGYDQDEDYQVRFPCRRLFQGEAVQIGSVRLEVLHTPGHTPEHLGFVVYDLARSEKIPQLLLSGDLLFVGSVGRPDLLGEEAKTGLARELYRSLRERLASLPDGVEVYPAHGAGSLCGSDIGGRPWTTLGFERAANPYLDPALAEEAFVGKILSTVPPFPPYYRRMKELNAQGPPELKGLSLPPAVEPAEFDRLRKEGAVVVDLRDQLAFGGGHIPGSLCVGAGPSFSVWAGWVVPPNAPILLVAEDGEDLQGPVHGLVRIGLDPIQGSLKGGLTRWREAGLPLRTTPQLSVHDLYRKLQDNATLTVLDVRSDGEWKEGHIQGALHVLAGELERRLEEVPPPNGPLTVICGTGYRSTVAVSVLERNGYENLANVAGGMKAWTAAGLPVVR